jgi:transposase-like protein
MAKKKSHNHRPEFIITDGLHSYRGAIWKEFHTKNLETIHVGNTGIRGKKYRSIKFDNNLIERMQGEIRERNKVQRGLKSEGTSFIRGHQLYHNFIRPHESLNGLTPAEISGINLKLGNKKWKNLLIKSVRNYKERES